MAHKLISDPRILWKLFEDYKTHIKSDPYIVVDYVGKDATPVNRMKEKPLTMVGFEVYVANQPGMPWDLDQYFANTNGSYSNYSSICTRIRKAIVEDQIGGGMAGHYNASLTARLNGLVDRQEVKTIKEQPLFSDEPTDEQSKP